MRKLETGLALIFAAAVSPSMASAQTATETAVGGGDEVRRLSDTTFSRWDVNSNDRLENGEFTSGLYELWSGQDGELNEQVFDDNWNNWFTADAPAFAELDEDDNNSLSQEELRVALNDADLNGEWQGANDGYLTPDEFMTGLNTVSDRDQSGTLDQQETEQLVAVVRVLVPVPVIAAVPTSVPAASSATGSSGVAVEDIIPLAQWNPDELYETAWSAETLFDRPVYGVGGEEIGDVEDLIIGPEGQLLSVVAEVGGFWDIGDTHVSVPWEQVVVRQGGTLAIPVTEDNADDFGVLRENARYLATNIVSNLDNEELGPRAWRASELIGDIARIRGDGQEPNSLAYSGYGYVEDLIFNEGKLSAAVVDRDPAGPDGPGEFAYPFYGYGYGWAPGNPYYDIPYVREEAATIVPFDADKLGKES